MTTDESDLDRIFSALADATRREILLVLRTRPSSVGELVDRFPLSQPAISKHLKVLESAGLVRGEREGRHIYRTLEFAPLIRAAIFVSQFEIQTDADLTRLEHLLARDPSGAPPTPPEET